MEFLITRLLNDLYQEIQTQHVINVEELNKNRISKILKSSHGEFDNFFGKRGCESSVSRIDVKHYKNYYVFNK